MRAKTVWWLWVGLLAVASPLSAKEPSYHGKKLSAWLDELYEVTGGGALLPGPASLAVDVAGEPAPIAPGTAPHDPSTKSKQDQAVEAIRHIGTDAIPYLLKIFRSREPGFMQRVVTLSFKASPSANERFMRSVSGFRALGSIAEMAIPELSEFVENSDTAYEASLAMVAIGPQSVPSLIKALRQPEERVWQAAAEALGQIITSDDAVLPVLLKCLKNKDPLVRSYAAAAIGVLGGEPYEVVPALITSLEDPQASVRNHAALTLGRFGSDAKAAVPALSKVIKDLDSSVSQLAAVALKQIDPRNDIQP